MSRTYISAELRQQVYDRASGCCEYCKIPNSHTLMPHEIDHIIAEKHGGQTIADNLALSCALCNKYKGSDIASVDPASGLIVPLFHPRQATWQTHFQCHHAQIEGITATGRVTVYLLRLNMPERVMERDLLEQANLLDVSR